MNRYNKSPKNSIFSKLLSVISKKKRPSAGKPKIASTKTQKHPNLTWIDLQDPLPSGLVQVTGDYRFQSVQIEQSLQKNQIAQMAVEDTYIFLILHFPYLLSESNRIATSQVSVFLGKDYLVTVHDSLTPSIRALFDSVENKHSADTKSPGHILFHIIEKLLTDVDKLIQEVSLELDEIESNVFDDRDSDAFQIGQLRQKIMRLRRTLATQKNVLDELDAIIDNFTHEHLERYYEINTNVSKKLWETVEEARETIEIYKDADFTTSTERTNEILAILTLLFTLTIPATIIGTFYGMNILLPGGIEAGSWTFLGNFTLLKLVAGISAVSAILMYLYFKGKKWF